MLNGNVEVLSNILDFTVSHIIVLVVIIVIVRDIVDDIRGVASLTVVLGAITLAFWLTVITELACLLDDFALWVDSSSFKLEALSRLAFLAQTWLILD